MIFEKVRLRIITLQIATAKIFNTFKARVSQPEPENDC
jgi:hypothetical protein